MLELRETQKPFQFRQGLDVRLLNEQRARLLFGSNYDGDFIFAFDDPKDTPIIEDKLKLIRQYHQKSRRIKFYVLCAYNRSSKDYSISFWIADLLQTCRRLALLNRYDCLGYLMRYKKYLDAPTNIKPIYDILAAYVNQPQFFCRMPLDEFAKRRRKNVDPLILTMQKILNGGSEKFEI